MTSAGRTVSTFGLGESYDENLLTEIADAGAGNYYYIASPEDAPAFSRKSWENWQRRGAEPHGGLHAEGLSSGRRSASFAGGNLPAKAGDVQTGTTRSVPLALEVPQVPVGAMKTGT